MIRETELTEAHEQVVLSHGARTLLEQRAKARSRTNNSIRGDTSRNSAPLSPSQQVMWLFTQLDNATPAYNRPMALRLVGELDEMALQRALTEIVRRHEVLRSRIAMDEGTPTQHAVTIATIALPVSDLRDIPESTRDERLRELLEAEARRPFDLTTGPLLRARLFRSGNRDQTLLITTHHIAADGWSDGVLSGELGALYGAFTAGKPSPLPELPLQYRDFATWQLEQERSAESGQHAAWWRDQLAGAPVEIDLAADRPHPELRGMRGGRVTMRLRPEIVDRLESIARQERATLAMTLLSAFHLFLARISGQSDMVIGLSIAGRIRADVAGLIGQFSDVLPVRVSVDRESTFHQLLARVRIAMLEAHEHQEVPLGALLEAVPSADGLRAVQVSQVLFNFRNMPFVPASLPELVVRPVDVFNGACVADLDLEVSQRGGGWECDLRYSAELYDDSTAARLLNHLGTLLDDIVASPEKAVGRLSLLTPDERRKLLIGWNGNARELPDCLNIHGLIEQQTRATPDSVALRCERGAITYRELDRRANALAESLVLQGIGAGSFVGVCMDRSIELVTSILGIWKAGGAFVPLDMDHPRSRLEIMLEDSRPELVIVDDRGRAALGAHNFDTLLVNSDYPAEIEGRDAPPTVAHQSDAVACVLYTSGSTGLPKGVLSTHRGIANNLLDMQRRYSLSNNDCVLQQTSIGFDGAAHELFWPLIAGAQIYLAPPMAQRDPRQIAAIIGEQNITMFGCTPSVLRLMVDQPGFKQSADLRLVTVMGEVLPPALQDQFFSVMPNAELVNIYGPCEASITVAVWTCERDSQRRSVPIGRPQTNVEIYILDQGLEPVPQGVAGEIYIGGVALSRGYLNRAELTAERFIQHPFRPQSGERVYRTGDIARYGADGVIEYIGRRDHQLKIRGVRVELGEVEATLDRLPGVKESVVVAHDAGEEKRVVAYVVLDDKSLTPLHLRRSLENRLPGPFMPAAIIPIDSIPRNPHGKVDRAALPDQSHTVETRTSDAGTPRNDLERTIATIWRALLGEQEIGIRDSFFDLGGHSLLAVRMLQRVSDEVGEAVSLRDLYAQPTIAAMAATMSGIASPGSIAKASPVLRLQEGGARPPLFYLHGQPPGRGRYAHALRDFMAVDQPIYIVRCPIFDGPVTAEGVSSELAEEIRAAHPTGPYLLAGNCFGAWLALEIARQLLARGESVPLVAIMHPNARMPAHLGYRSIRRLAMLAGVPENLQVTEAASATDYVRRMATLVWREQRRSSPRQLFGRVAAAGGWAAGYLNGQTRTFVSSWRTRKKAPPSREEQAAANSCYMSPDEQVEAHYGYWWDAWMNYVPRPYPGRVTMLWPAEMPGNPPWNPVAPWSDITPALDWRVVPGNHMTMMKDQFQFTAQELRACIDEVIA